MTTFGVNVEIHFHAQDEASIFMETDTVGLREAYGETLLASLYAARQLANLRHESQSLAELLALASPQDLPDLIDSDDGCRLVPFSGHRGRKRFEVKLRSNGHLKFRLKARGFGPMASGIGYYAPISTVLLIRHLGRRRRQDEGFIERLAEAISSVGNLTLAGELSVRTQHRVAMFAVTSAYDDLLDELFPEL